MTQGLQEQVVPELTSKGSRYRKALYQYPASVHDRCLIFVANRVVVWKYIRLPILIHMSDGK